jgi:hypothetical protein
VRYGKNGFATALPLLERAFALQSQQGPADGPELAAAMAKLGECCVFTGQLARADGLLKKALAIREKMSGPEDPQTGHVLASLAMLHIIGSHPGTDPFMLLMQLSLKPLPLPSIPLPAREFAEKALRCFNSLQQKKYDSADFQPKNEFNYDAMATAFILDDTMNNDFDQKLRQLKGSSGGAGSAPGQGCFVATAVYGSSDCEPVRRLRRIRDEKLEKTVLGRAFVNVYYRLGPHAARIVQKQKRLSAFLRFLLDQLIRMTWRE